MISGVILSSPKIFDAPTITQIAKERLSPKHIHLRDRKLSSKLFVPYTRKSNLCKSAKIRKILQGVGRSVKCQPNWQVAATTTPNDVYYPSQFALPLISASEAWETTTGSDQLLVAVIDTGIDYTHPDLSAKMWRNPGEIPGNGVDDDKNGYVDDVHGINAITNTGNPMDDNSHGTHVAGIIGASTNNNRGISGVAWNVRLVGAKFLSATGSGSLANAIKALSYVNALKKAGHNVVVTNNSWGGTVYSQALRDVIDESRRLGIVFVAAAGNNSSNNDAYPFYPASYAVNNVISVASITSTKAFSSFSNYGKNSVHIAAPGSGILSTVRLNSYSYKSGTSMAAPHVAGVALLTQAACSGSLSAEAIKDIVTKNGVVADHLKSLTSSGSVVNADLSVLAAQNLCNATPTPVNTLAPTQTATPTTTPGLTTPTPENTPTATTTPTPTQTPTPTITNTPTPTRTPTATPVSAKLSFAPRLVGPKKTTYMTLENIPTESTTVLVRFLIRDASNKSWVCRGKTTPVFSSKTLRLQLPQEVTQFASIHTLLYGPKYLTQNSILIDGTNVMRGDAAAANKLCVALESQL